MWSSKFALRIHGSKQLEVAKTMGAKTVSCFSDFLNYSCYYFPGCIFPDEGTYRLHLTSQYHFVTIKKVNVFVI